MIKVEVMQNELGVSADATLEVRGGILLGQRVIAMQCCRPDEVVKYVTIKLTEEQALTIGEALIAAATDPDAPILDEGAFDEKPSA